MPPLHRIGMPASPIAERQPPRVRPRLRGVAAAGQSDAAGLAGSAPQSEARTPTGVVAAPGIWPIINKAALSLRCWSDIVPGKRHCADGRAALRVYGVGPDSRLCENSTAKFMERRRVA